MNLEESLAEEPLVELKSIEKKRLTFRNPLLNRDEICDRRKFVDWVFLTACLGSPVLRARGGKITERCERDGYDEAQNDQTVQEKERKS